MRDKDEYQLWMRRIKRTRRQRVRVNVHPLTDLLHACDMVAVLMGQNAGVNRVLARADLHQALVEPAR